MFRDHTAPFADQYKFLFNGSHSALRSFVRNAFFTRMLPTDLTSVEALPFAKIP